jgi:class 3 adenylate cyclase
MPPVRRLAAILAADVAGYSRLMGADEEGTHERLKEHLRELIEPKIAEHRGRVVKNTGDGFLAEFASVLDAVRCAVEVQRGMAARDPEVAEENRIRFRVGIACARSRRGCRNPCANSAGCRAGSAGSPAGTRRTPCSARPRTRRAHCPAI